MSNAEILGTVMGVLMLLVLLVLALWMLTWGCSRPTREVKRMRMDPDREPSLFAARVQQGDFLLLPRGVTVLWRPSADDPKVWPRRDCALPTEGRDDLED